MQVTIAATSSRLDEDTILIEVSTTIGESVTTQRCGYSVFELEHSRYISGTLEERIEKLRQSAQDSAQASLEAQLAIMMARFQKPVDAPKVSPEEQAEHDATTLAAELSLEAPVEPVKKTRAARKAKTPTTQE
ncbi:MAG: hypothetical protein ACOH2R_17510 [Pseudomonas sp.]